MGDIFNEIFKLEFWEQAMERFRHLGPAIPILLAFLESFLPPLPLVGIVALNVAAYGVVKGFLFTWTGAALGGVSSFFLFRKGLKGWAIRLAGRHPRIMKARLWVDGVSTFTLFIIILMPFTPISFVNFAFGVSDYPAKRYLLTLCSAKFFMLMILVMISKSVFKAFSQPVFILVAAALIAVSVFLSKKIVRKKISLGDAENAK